MLPDRTLIRIVILGILQIQILNLDEILVNSCNSCKFEYLQELQEFTGITRIYRNYRNLQELQEFSGIFKNFQIKTSYKIMFWQPKYCLPSPEVPFLMLWTIYRNYKNLQEFTGITGIYRNFGYDNDLSLEFEIYVLYTILIDFGEWSDCVALHKTPFWRFIAV